MIQRDRVLAHLKKYGSITQVEAAKKYGIYRLSEYIRQARLTLNIKDKWEKTTNRYGEKVEYKRYWIEE